MRMPQVRTASVMAIIVLACAAVICSGCRAKTSTPEAQTERKTPATEEMTLPEGEEDVDMLEWAEDMGE